MYRSLSCRRLEAKGSEPRFRGVPSCDAMPTETSKKPDETPCYKDHRHRQKPRNPTEATLNPEPNPKPQTLNPKL